MPKAGKVDSISIYQRGGNWYEMYRGKYAGGGQGIMFTRKLFGQSIKGSMSKSKVSANVTKVKAQSFTTHKTNLSLRNSYSMLRFLNNPNLYTSGGLINGDGGMALMVASRVSQTIKSSANVAFNIYDAMSGETTKTNNRRNLLNAVLDPVSLAIDSTYGRWVDTMRVERVNRGLEYHRGLTGQVVNTKDKGKY